MNTKKVRIFVPNSKVLSILVSTPTFSRLSREELVVGDNYETVNHKQFSDMIRLYPTVGVEVFEI